MRLWIGVVFPFLACPAYCGKGPFGLNPDIGPVNRLGDVLFPQGPAAEAMEVSARLEAKGGFGNLPDSFDARDAWPTCIPPVLNQGDCGSCWSFGATKQLSAALCIAKTERLGRPVNVTVLSPQDLLSCEHLNLGCTMGSMPQWADAFLEKEGVTALACTPYVSGDGHDEPCPRQCADPSVPYAKHYAANHTHLGSFFAPTHPHALEEILDALTRGPVTATFSVFSDFYNTPPGGIYEHRHGSFEGLHTVMVVGYGVDQATGTPFYSVSNSWGDYNGPGNGYFKIARGKNTAGFEQLMYQAAADLSREPTSVQA